MSIACGQCGAVVGGRGGPLPKFCPQCGAGVPQPAPPRAASDAGGALMCPHCRTSGLQIADRAGIEIDFCPKCRGVWLDRGELDKIIERMGGDDDDDRRPGASAPPPQRYDDDDDYHRGPQRKRKSMFGQIFDIFD